VIADTQGFVYEDCVGTYGYEDSRSTRCITLPLYPTGGYVPGGKEVDFVAEIVDNCNGDAIGYNASGYKVVNKADVVATSAPVPVVWGASGTD
jgi:hypothetical protein